MVFEQLPIIIFVVVIAAFITSIYVAVRYHPDQFGKTRINLFFSALASLAIFFVGVNIILSSISFEYNQEYLRVSQSKQAIDKLWLYPLKLITHSKEARPEFIAGFFYNNMELYKATKAEQRNLKQTSKSVIEEQFISLVIIQAWEDFLIQKNFNRTELNSWLKSFIIWAQNPYLKYYFDIAKFEYEARTVEFGELLFEYAKNIPIPTVSIDIYDSTVTQLLNDRRFLKILS